MSERAPEGPKPGPGLRKVESQADIIARLEADLAEPVEAAGQPSSPSGAESIDVPAQSAEESPFHFVDKRNNASQAWSKEMKDQDAQAELDAQLNTVESMDVAEDPFTAEEASNSIPAVAETAITPAANEALDVPEAEAPPKRPQSTHHDYHTQRPADGSVYRTSKNFQRAPGGTEPVGIAKNGREEYDKQIGANDPTAADKHYDEVNGLNEVQPATPERPTYETMDTDQLIFAYAKAEMIGDKHVTDDIRNVYAEAMEKAYTEPGSPISYDEHMEALARFDRMADAAIEYEKAKDPEHSELVDAAVERANKEPTIGDKLKKWWGNHSESILNKFRPSYWAERWENAAKPALEKGYDKMLNVGVKPEDDPEEVERKRKRNRVVMIAGGAAVAIAAIAGPAFGIGFAVGGGGHHAAEAANAAGGGHGTGIGDTLSTHDQSVANALNPQHGHGDISQYQNMHGVAGQGGGQEVAPLVPVAPTVEGPSASDLAALNVSHNEGGILLFDKLHIDPGKWASNAERLLREHGNDFYRMPSGGIGLSHSGLLSSETQADLLSLKS